MDEEYIKDFTEDGYPILTKKGFIKAIMELREAKEAIKQQSTEKRIIQPKVNKITKPQKKTTPAKKPSKTVSETFKKEIIDALSKKLEAQVHDATLSFNNGIEKYTLQVKTHRGKFEGFNGVLNVKDKTREKIINAILDFDMNCEKGLMNGAGEIGFKKDNIILTGTLTKKRQ